MNFMGSSYPENRFGEPELSLVPGGVRLATAGTVPA